MTYLFGVSFLLSLTFLFSTFSSAEVDYKLPYPAGKSYKVRQGNMADTNGDQKPDPDGSHGFFPGVNDRNADQKATYGFDFEMKEGEDIVAAAKGIVALVKDTSAKGGCSRVYQNDANYIVINHPDGTSTLYLHLQYKSAKVKRGDDVKQGQQIAKSGNTGWSCGAHLHFQRQELGKSWYTNSLPIAFSDVLENKGVPIATRFYTSRNYYSVQPITGKYIGKLDRGEEVTLELKEDGTALGGVVSAWNVVWYERDNPPYSPSIHLLCLRSPGKPVLSLVAGNGKKPIKMTGGSFTVDFWHSFTDVLEKGEGTKIIRLKDVMDPVREVPYPGEVAIWTRYVGTVHDGQKIILELKEIPNFTPSWWKQPSGNLGACILNTPGKWMFEDNKIKLSFEIREEKQTRELEVKGNSLIDKKYGLTLVKSQ